MPAPSVTIRPWQPADAEACAALTFPAYRAQLAAVAGAPHLVARVACAGEQPVGLAFGRVGGDAWAELYSVFVQRSHRRNGAGKGLLEAWERAATQGGARQAQTQFSTGLPGAAAYAGLLAARGWSAPVTRQKTARLGHEVLAAPWLNGALPPRFTISLWCDITSAERAGLEKEERAGALPDLPTPLSRPEPADPATSLVVRAEGRIVGWLLNRAAAPGLICYIHLYLRPEVRGRVPPLALAAEAVRRQDAAYGRNSQGLFTVWAANAVALRLFERKVIPFARAWSETKGSTKALAASS